MKKLLVVLSLVFANVSFAETINVNWKVDNTTYTTSTCESGGNLIIPQTPPTKYGYTFVGWNYGIIKGTWSQSGTPTPNNPTEPVFYQLGNTVLRALGSGENFIADEYNPSTEKITRYVGVKVLDGSENWMLMHNDNTDAFTTRISDMKIGNNQDGLCTRFTKGKPPIPSGAAYVQFGAASNYVYFRWLFGESPYQTESAFKQWLADQYANGTPVTVYYPLAEPVEESWSLLE